MLPVPARRARIQSRRDQEQGLLGVLVLVIRVPDEVGHQLLQALERPIRELAELEVHLACSGVGPKSGTTSDSKHQSAQHRIPSTNQHPVSTVNKETAAHGMCGLKWS